MGGARRKRSHEPCIVSTSCMTTQLARPHNHLSNRAKVRSALERKSVFKSVLENPFQISWPSVPVNVQNVVLARLVAALENVPPRTHSSRKSPQKTRLSDHQANVLRPEEAEYGCTRTSPSQIPGPECTDRIPGAVIGINAVTRALELQLRVARKHVDIPAQNGNELPPHSTESTPSPIVIVFACCADVDPPVLVDHILHLVAGCNSPRNVTQPIKLIPLPRGSESTISQVIGVRRAAIIAFRHGSPTSEIIRDTLEFVPIVSVPWLSGAQVTPQLLPAHIKQLRTTAPKDMKAARQQRSKARTAAKRNISASSQSVRRRPRVMLTTE